MDDKLYIKKFIRDDGEILSFDGVELYLAQENTLLVRPDPNTTAVDYTEADGGEMVRQQNMTYDQPINGLIIPKTTDYWTLTTTLSQFFKINHYYKIIYVKKDGSMFSINGAWISAGLQIVPVPHEEYSAWSITLTIGNTAWTEYAEDSEGKEIYSNTITLPLVSLALGGEVWDASKNILPSDGLTPATVAGSLVVQPQYSNGQLIYLGFDGQPDTDVKFTIGYMNFQKGRTYTFSGVTGGDNASYGMLINSCAAFPSGVALYDGSETITAVDNASNIEVYLWIKENYVANTVLTYPQIEIGDTATAYEPYQKGGGAKWDSVGEVWEAGNGGVQTVNIDSTQAIYPVWIVEGPCVNPRLQNNTTDTNAEFDGTVAAGQTLTVDFAEGIAYLDSALVTRDVFGSVYFNPGENIAGFNSDGGATDSCTISWNNVIN